jgi:hypothetical protein
MSVSLICYYRFQLSLFDFHYIFNYFIIYLYIIISSTFTNPRNITDGMYLGLSM